MEELLKKIETYNIINYLLPGVIFGVIFTYLIGINIYDENFIIATVEYYFTGLVLSRIGSVMIKPILKKMNVIYEKDYKQFIKKEKEDEKISLLVREGNQYRTFIATFLTLILVELVNIFMGVKDKYMMIFVFIFLTILFTFSYRKQTKLITKRIE